MSARSSRRAGLGAWLCTLAAAFVVAGCERPPVETVQRGYRGTAMDAVYNPRILAAQAANNALPFDPPMVPAVGPKASTVFKNLQVVGDLSVGEFTRLMVSITAWVAPEQGCSYCHAVGQSMASDSVYTKVVARRMLQMTRHINADWKTHVATTGVTCYSCHRGKPVPANIWFAPPVDAHFNGMVGNRAGQNAPAPSVGYASLPNDPFSRYLTVQAEQPNIRVIGPTALPTGNRQSTKQTEATYGLMMHMSTSLGVNCTYCHNSRSFGQWNTSSPQRVTAWYGIRMTRDLNTNYLDPLAGVFPVNRLGPTGDVPKLNCATCHQGAYKPLYGAKVLATHPELVGTPMAAPSEAASGAAAAASASVTTSMVGQRGLDPAPAVASSASVMPPPADAAIVASMEIQAAAAYAPSLATAVRSPPVAAPVSGVGR